MLAKFLGGGLSRRPLNAAAELLPTGAIGKGMINMQRGAPGNRMAAGLTQELQGRRVPPAHPWYQNITSNRGTMQASNAELKPFVKQMSLQKAARHAVSGKHLQTNASGRAVNPNSTFDVSQLMMPNKMASIRATPIAKMIAGIAARNVQF